MITRRLLMQFSLGWGFVTESDGESVIGGAYSKVRITYEKATGEGYLVVYGFGRLFHVEVIG